MTGLRIVEQNISTALIMEDDMDWDIRLKSQLQNFARGSRFIRGTENPKTSPYGDGWDVLWLGHCGEIFPETLDENRHKPASDADIVFMSRKYTTKDSTVPPPDQLQGFQNTTEFPYTRWAHQSRGPIYTFAYALSQAGARKVLFDLSVDHLQGPFDNSLAGFCRWGSDARKLDAKCISSTPELFHHHKAKGGIAGDSDIQNVGGGGEIREKGFTENIVLSVRNNLGDLLAGKEVESMFD